MSLTPSNNNFNNNARNYNQYDNNGGEKEKTNFKIAQLWLNDGRIEVSAWKSSNSAMYTSILLRQMIGKDPQGKSTFEAGMAKDMPSILLRCDHAQSLYEYCMNTKPEKLSLIDWDPWKEVPGAKSNGTTISIIGSPGKITLTIKTPQKGERSVSINGSPMGDTYVYGHWNNFLKALNAGINLGVFSKMSDEIAPMAQQEGAPF